MTTGNRKTSLRGLRTFCIAAEHASFRAAADELFVTASAVSHQIKNLEEEFGLELFDRSGRALVLTEVGEALFADVEPLISRLDQVTSSYRKKQKRHTLRISVQPFFASELLVPHLSEFTERYPEIDMQLETIDESSEKHPPSADVSIRVFRSAPPNLASDAFFPLRLIPACSPELHKKIVNGGKNPKRPFPVIVHTRRSGQWKLWTESAGIRLPEITSTIQLDSTVAVVRAAEQGLGVALVPMPLSKARFDSGSLVRVYEHEADTPERYYVVCSPSVANKKPVQAFRNWVLQTFSPMV